MKKNFLLLASMLLSAATMSAAEEDITPAGYIFNNLTEFHYVDKAFTGANITTPVYESIGGDAVWNDGACVVAGGQFANPAQPYFTDLKAGTSLVDLGGEVGKVFCISGKNSKVNDKIKELYGVEMSIPSCTGGLNWFNINWLSDPSNTPLSNGSTTQIRVRLVLNVYANTLNNANNIINSAYAVNDQGGINPSGSNTATGTAITTGEFGKQVEGNLVWDPTRWLVYEFDTWCPENDESDTKFYPIRLKMEMNQGNFTNSTVFIKEVKFTKLTDNTETIVGTRRREYKTLTIAPTIISGVETGIAAGSALKCSVNGNTVTINEDADIFTTSGMKVATVKAGESVELAKGFYVTKSATESMKIAVK
ncbi:MAG: hypothetical protein PUD91_01885 [Bacteroidales bacterium]|nr:hypothetical protein [Bacteroidales bacterium]